MNIICSRTVARKKLAQALTEANAPQEMIRSAREGYYGDFNCPLALALPITQLISDAQAAGLTDIANRAMEGEFDD